MQKSFDRYVARSFLTPWTLCTGCVIGLYVVIDLFEHLNDFISRATSWGGFLFSVFRYYATIMPLILSRIMWVITVISVLLALFRLARHNELTTLKACGISFQRTVLPLLIIGAILGSLLALNQEILMPSLDSSMRRVSLELCGSEEVPEDLFAVDVHGQAFLVTALHTNDGRPWLSGVYMTRRDEPGTFFYAETGHWENGELVLRNVFHSTASFSEIPKKTPQKTLDELRVATDLDDKEFIVSEFFAELKTIGQLRRIYTLFPHMAQRLKVAIHTRLAFCVANVVLILVAVPYAFQQENRNTLVGIGAGLLVAIAYYLVSMFCESLGNNSVLTPSMAGWLPIVAFGGLGVFLFRSMPT